MDVFDYVCNILKWVFVLPHHCQGSLLWSGDQFITVNEVRAFVLLQDEQQRGVSQVPAEQQSVSQDWPVLAASHYCSATGHFNQVSPEYTGIGYSYKGVNKLKMPTKKKKTSQGTDKETEGGGWRWLRGSGTRAQEEKQAVQWIKGWEKIEVEEEEVWGQWWRRITFWLVWVGCESNKKKQREKGQTKNKTEKSKELSGDELIFEDNKLKDKREAEKLPDVIETTKKGSEKSSVKDKMGSKDKNKKGEEQAAGDEDEGKMKKKEKKKKSSMKGDADEDNKKTKGKKKKVENYVEIYENELRNYESEQVENYEDEYHKKKGNCTLFSLTYKM